MKKIVEHNKAFISSLKDNTLINYDIKNVEGAVGRYPNIEFARSVSGTCVVTTMLEFLLICFRTSRMRRNRCFSGRLQHEDISLSRSWELAGDTKKHSAKS